MVIIDSCFSGQLHGLMAVEADALRAQVATAGAVVITSARHDLPARAPVGETYTAFTGELLRVLTEGIAGGAAEITVDAAYTQLRAVLAGKGRPLPERTGTDTAGALVIANNPAYRLRSPAPATPLPPPCPAPGTHLQRLAARLVPQQPDDVGTARLFQGPAMVGERYEFLRLIGSGGMGTVHLARDRLLDRPVAIKTYKSTEKNESVQQWIFRNEARAVAALNHPNVAAIYDAGEGRDGWFIAMEYVRGVSLRSLLADGGLSPDEAMEAIHDVLSVLDAAHKVGVLHCDVKPDNVMLSPNGTIKMLDFGVSRFQSQPSPYEEEEHMLVGTPFYLPPEAWRGVQPTMATDIYAAGVTLYELCTGQRPFQGDSAFQIMMGVLDGPVVPPGQLTPELSPRYETIILRAMDRDPVARYESAAEMRGAIAAVLYGTG